MTVDPRDAARLFQRYAKQYQAGAFATPLVADIAAGDLRTWTDDETGLVSAIAMVRRLTRDSRRKDFTGAPYLVPKGALVVTHLALAEGAAVPELDEFDYIYAYVEDRRLADGLAAQGREPRAVRISAASEVIACYGREGEGRRYPPHDSATLCEVPLGAPAPLRSAVETELAGVGGWHDDYPYYNRDGSWSAVSLRGFKPGDPTWGIKPSEMSKAWLAEHPDAAALGRCDWTVIAARLPAMMELLESVGWWRRFERVRLLKLSGRGGKGGKLLRHTDITDRAAGTDDGQICRFHIPLVTDPAVRTVAWDLGGHEVSMHLAPWKCYYLDQRKPHMVLNPSTVERVHLVVDVLADADVRHQIGAAA